MDETKITYEWTWKPRVFMGCRVIESELMVDSVEDWSRVRSPSRARRRMRRGYRQNVTIRHVPKREAMQLANGDIILHPAKAAELRAAVAERTRTLVDRMTEDLIYGRGPTEGFR